jgi:hypothetical protein
VKFIVGSFVFLLVFLVVGVAMHIALYQGPGLFIWSIQEDAANGSSQLVRTSLATPVESTNTVPVATEPLESAPAPEVAAQPEAPAPDPGVKILFDGKELGAWQVTRFGGEGETIVNEEGFLEFGFGAIMTGVHWGGQVPALSNYEISLEAMKLDGNDFFCALTFPVANSHATFVIGGWGGGVVGLSSVDDLDASENETMNIEGFEKNKWYAVRVRVTDAKIEAWIDDDQKVDLELAGRKISLRPGDIELSVPIGIASFQTRSQFRNIVWRDLTVPK